MEEIIYYTLSTIAQVLGALIALLGVFAIFHLQYLNIQLDGFSQNYLDTLKEIQSINPINVSGFVIVRFKKNQLCRDRLGNLQLMQENDRSGGIYQGLQSIYHSFSNLITHRKIEINLTIKVAVISVILILISISTLPFAGEISGLIFWIIFGVVFLVLSGLMVLIIKLIKSALLSNNT